MGIIVTTTLASIDRADIPGAGMVMPVIIITTYTGIPKAGLALILAVNKLLEMCKTVVNLTGDAAVSIIINNSASI